MFPGIQQFGAFPFSAHVLWRSILALCLFFTIMYYYCSCLMTFLLLCEFSCWFTRDLFSCLHFSYQIIFFSVQWSPFRKYGLVVVNSPVFISGIFFLYLHSWKSISLGMNSKFLVIFCHHLKIHLCVLWLLSFSLSLSLSFFLNNNHIFILVPDKNIPNF
jgi:hypothetical protein